MAKNAQEVAAKWATNLGQSTEHIKAGVMAVTEAPGAAAARNKAGYLAGVQRSVDKWASRVGSVSLGDWQNAMITKGTQRIQLGASQAQPKFATFMQSFLPHVESVAARVRTMPKGTLDAGIQRAIAQITGNAQYKRPAAG